MTEERGITTVVLVGVAVAVDDEEAAAVERHIGGLCMSGAIAQVEFFGSKRVAKDIFCGAGGDGNVTGAGARADVKGGAAVVFVDEFDASECDESQRVVIVEHGD